MTSTQTQLRRGTSAQCDAMTPAEGEVVVDLTNDRLRVGDGVTAGGLPVPVWKDIQNQAFVYATVGGTGNAITLTPAKALPSYVAGVSFEFKATADNTGATTINVSGLGTVTVQKNESGTLTGLSANDIKNGIIYRVTYNGTIFQLMNGSSSGAYTFQDGLTESSGVVGINTNNSQGIGAYGYFANFTLSPITDGSTTAASNIWVFKISFNSTTGAITGAASSGTHTGTWRNVSGYTVRNGSSDNTGLFIRVA